MYCLSTSLTRLLPRLNTVYPSPPGFFRDRGLLGPIECHMTKKKGGGKERLIPLCRQEIGPDYLYTDSVTYPVYGYLYLCAVTHINNLQIW